MYKCVRVVFVKEDNIHLYSTNPHKYENPTLSRPYFFCADNICVLCALCVCFRGLAAGEDNGQRGYMLTFVIAYLRVCYQTLITFFLKTHVYLSLN